jgi:hypothetical protein
MVSVKLGLVVCISFFAAAAQQPAAQNSSASFILQGGTIHTISGTVIENGSVLVRDGKSAAAYNSL